MFLEVLPGKVTSQKVSFSIMYSGQSADRDSIRDVYIDNAYEGKYVV